MFTIIQISSFVNQSWVQHRGSGWLGDMQTHGWDTDSGTIIFLHTWSKGNFSDEELLDLELLFRVYLIGLTREAQEYVSQLHFTCKFNPKGIRKVPKGTPLRRFSDFWGASSPPSGPLPIIPAAL